MIRAVLIFNNNGKPRLMHWYTQLDVASQQRHLADIYRLIKARPESACNFFSGNLTVGLDTRIVYRHYATLYFVFLVDSNESELGILDLIQVFVESLDSIFVNVCELDIIFKPNEVSLILGEIVSGGIVLETSLPEILKNSCIKRLG